MADGEARPATELDNDKRPGLLKRIASNRQTGFAASAILIFIAIGGISGWLLYREIATPDIRLFSKVIAASSLSLLPLFMLARDTRENFARGPSAGLPILAMTTLFLTTAFVVAVASGTAEEWGLVFSSSVDFYLIALSGLFLSIVSLGWNAYNLASFAARAGEAQHREAIAEEIRSNDEQKNAEAMSALIATLVFLSVGSLAVAAGAWGEQLQLRALYGVGLSAVVVSIFAIVIFLEPLANLPFIRALSRMLRGISAAARPFALFYDAIDTFLVRIGAVVAGMEHRGMWARYAVLSSLLVCMCILGWYLPPPYGFLPCILGLTLAISVSRLWSWVEDDRALAALTDFRANTPVRTPMRDDYRDETLLGFIFVFAFMPIMMRQAHNSGAFGPEMFSVPGDQNTFFNWLGFFGIELAKAVPIVDWAEIYQIQTNGENGLIAMKSTASRHAVFLARATVDLVLIAALLQAIGISNRNRQQKRLYKAGADPAFRHRPGLIDRLDTFVERSELKKAVSATRRRGGRTPDADTTPQEAHDKIFDLSRLRDGSLIDFRRYNADRLSEIYADTKNSAVRAFISAIAHERPDLHLKPRLVLLDEYAETKRSEADLYGVLKRIEADIAKGSLREPIELEQLRSIMIHTRSRVGLKDFKEEIIDLIVRRGPAGEAIEMLGDIAGRSNRDEFAYGRTAAVRGIVKSVKQSNDPIVQKQACELLRELCRMDLGVMTLNAIANAIDEIC